jgi:hypothetical protein
MATNETKDPTSKKWGVLDFWGLVVPNNITFYPTTFVQNLDSFKQYSHLLLSC